MELLETKPLGPALYEPQEPTQEQYIETLITPQSLANATAIEAAKEDWLPNLLYERGTLSLLDRDQTDTDYEYRNPVTPMTKDEANQQGEDYGLRFNEDTTKEAFYFLVERAKARRTREALLSQAPDTLTSKAQTTLLSLATNMADPIGLAVSFVPVIGEARMGMLMSSLGRTGGRFAGGMVDAAVGNIAVEPAFIGAHSQLQDDYTAADAFLNVTLGSILGGGLHAAFGRIGDEFQVSRVRELFDEGTSRAEVRDFLFNSLDDASRAEFEKLTNLTETPRFRNATPDAVFGWFDALTPDQRLEVYRYGIGRILNGQEPDLTPIMRDMVRATELANAPPPAPVRNLPVVYEEKLPEGIPGQRPVTDVRTGPVTTDMIKKSRKVSDKAAYLFNEAQRYAPELHGWRLSRGNIAKDADYRVDVSKRTITLPTGQASAARTIDRTVAAITKALDAERSRSQFVNSAGRTATAPVTDVRQRMEAAAKPQPYNVDTKAGAKNRVELERLKEDSDEVKRLKAELDDISDYISTRNEGDLGADDLAEFEEIKAEVMRVEQEAEVQMKIVNAFASCVARG